MFDVIRAAQMSLSAVQETVNTLNTLSVIQTPCMDCEYKSDRMAVLTFCTFKSEIIDKGPFMTAVLNIHVHDRLTWL